MAGVAFETASQIIQDAAYELGLIAADVDVFASTDQNLVQLRRLLTRVGRDILKERRWSHLQKPHTITTGAADATYDLPADFDRMIPQTYWNRTTVFPGVPIGAEVWQYLQANTSSPISALFRLVNNEVQIYPTPSSIQTIALEYISSYWVMETGQVAGNETRCDANTDSILFDSTLVMHALKRAFLEAKGFDSTAAGNAYERRLALVCGSDGSAPVLSIGPSRGGALLGDWNIPETGFGS